MFTEYKVNPLIKFKSINELSDFLFSHTERFYFTTINNLDGELVGFKMKYKFSPELRWTTITPQSVFQVNRDNKLELILK